MEWHSRPAAMPRGRGAFQSGAETQPPQPRRASGPSGTRQGGWRSMTSNTAGGSPFATSRTSSRGGLVFQGKSVVVVMPAYNAARTLRADLRRGHGAGNRRSRHRRRRRAAATRPSRSPGRCPSVLVHVHPSEPRLRRQPEDLLPAGARGGRRHRRHGPPRLPVHAAADPGDGVDDRPTGCITCVLGLAHPRRLRARRAACRSGSTWRTASSRSSRTC